MTKQKFRFFLAVLLACSFFLFPVKIFAAPMSEHQLLAQTPDKDFPDWVPVDFKKVDPLQVGGSTDPINKPTPSTVDLGTPGKIISRGLQFAIPLAGLILFVMIVSGGFEMVAGAAESKSKEAGRERITAAVIGFILLFAAYWIAQVIQVIFRVQIL
jgi:hypothetical protein